MSGSAAPWDAELQGWRVSRGPVGPARPRRSRRGRKNLSLWRRPRGFGEVGADAAVPWDTLRQRWDDDGSGARAASASAASGHRAGALLRGTAVPLCALAVSAFLAVLGHWWAACVVLVWAALVDRGIRAVRRAAAEEQAADMEGAALPAVLPTDPRPVSPVRAFGQGVAQVLAFPALFAPGSARSAPGFRGRTGPDGSAPEPSLERSRRDVAEALLRAHAELGLRLPGEPVAGNGARNTGGAP